MIRQSTNGPSHPEICLVERSLIVHSLRGHRRSTSSASDASGEAGSEQGWSVVGPPGKRASKTPPSYHEHKTR